MNRLWADLGSALKENPDLHAAIVVIAIIATVVIKSGIIEPRYKFVTVITFMFIATGIFFGKTML